MSQTIKKTIFWILLASLFFFLSSLFPYVSDDWVWGSVPFSLETFITSQTNSESPLSFYNNGRYIGNGLGFLAANIPFLRNLIMAGTLTGINLLIVVISGMSDKPTSFSSFVFVGLLSSGLLLASPIDRFRQSVAWSSAFMIYVVAAFLCLADLWILLRESRNSDHLWSFPIAFFLPFLSSFFTENISIGFVLFSGVSILLCLIRKKRLSGEQLLFFFGTLTGTVLMLSDDGYRSIFNQNEATYWSVKTGSILEMLRLSINTFQDVIVFDLLSVNAVLNLFIAGVCLILSRNFFLREPHNSRKTVLILTGNGICVLIALLGLFRELCPELVTTNLFPPFLATMTFFSWFGSLIFIIFSCVRNPFRKNRLMKLFLMLICITLPLLVAKPLSGRIFFPMAVLQQLFCIELFKEIGLTAFDNSQLSSPHKLLPLLFSAVFFFSFYLGLAGVYSIIHHYDIERLKFIKNNEVNGIYYSELPKLPYESLLITSTPFGEGWEEYFRKANGFDEKMKFHIITFEEWMEIVKTE